MPTDHKSLWRCEDIRRWLLITNPIFQGNVRLRSKIYSEWKPQKNYKRELDGETSTFEDSLHFTIQQPAPLLNFLSCLTVTPLFSTSGNFGNAFYLADFFSSPICNLSWRLLTSSVPLLLGLPRHGPQSTPHSISPNLIYPEDPITFHALHGNFQMTLTLTVLSLFWTATAYLRWGGGEKYVPQLLVIRHYGRCYIYFSPRENIK